MEKRGSNARTIGPMSLAVSAELRAELARQGYSVQSFARHSNLPVSTLHKTLKGQRVVDVEDLFSICEALMVQPGTIVDRASREALSRIAHGVLWQQGDSGTDEPSATIHRPDFGAVDDELAAASPFTEEDPDSGYDGA